MFYFNCQTEKIMFSTTDGCLALTDSIKGSPPEATFNSVIGAKFPYIEIGKDLKLDQMQKATAQLRVEAEERKVKAQELEKFNAMNFWQRNPTIAVIKNKRVGPRTSRLYGGTEVGVASTDFKEVNAIFKDFSLLVEDSSVEYITENGCCYSKDWEPLGKATTDAGDVIMSFDKRYKGKKIMDIPHKSLIWFMQNVNNPKPFQLKSMAAIKEYLEENEISYEYDEEW